MSTEPDKPQTPVSRGERIAAGVLALFYAAIGGIMLASGEDVRSWPSEMLQHMAAGWQALLKLGSPNLNSALSDYQVVEALAMAFVVTLVVGNFVLLPFALARAKGRGWLHQTRFAWFAALGHGSFVFWLSMVLSRLDVIYSGSRAPWFRGWLEWSFLVEFWTENPSIFVFAAEILLAAAVLWFTRRRKGEAQARAADAQG